MFLGEEVVLRVLIDGRMFQGKMHGLARYVYAIVEHMSKLRPEWEFGVLQLEDYFGDLASRYSNITPVSVKSRPFSWGEHWEIPKVIEDWHPALFHATTIAVPARIPGRSVVTVPDLTLYHYPRRGWEKFYFRWLLKPVLKRCQGIITYSQHTAQDLERSLAIELAKITVCPLGVEAPVSSSANSSAVSASAPESASVLESPSAFEPMPWKYVLCVANPRPHKNLSLLLQVWKTLESEALYSKLGLVIVSSSSPLLVEQMADLKRVRLLSAVSDEQLWQLYKQAELFVMPSLYEGFGLPLAEAMQAGAPCLSSQAASLPEVGGQACLYFDPHSATDLAEKMRGLLSDSCQLEKLAQAGLERGHSFSWSKAAQLHIQAYMQAISA